MREMADYIVEIEVGKQFNDYYTNLVKSWSKMLALSPTLEAVTNDKGDIIGANVRPMLDTVENNGKILFYFRVAKKMNDAELLTFLGADVRDPTVPKIKVVGINGSYKDKSRTVLDNKGKPVLDVRGKPTVIKEYDRIKPIKRVDITAYKRKYTVDSKAADPLTATIKVDPWPANKDIYLSTYGGTDPISIKALSGI